MLPDLNKIHLGDALDTLRQWPDNFVDTCVTSPPYFNLRDYGVDGQIGLEESPDAYIAKLVEVFREVRRVLKPEGTLWLNLGDSYFNAAPGSGGNGDKSGLRNDGRNEEGRIRAAKESIAHQTFNPVASAAPAVDTMRQGIEMGCAGNDSVVKRSRSQRLGETGVKPKDLLMIPAQVALALRADGWYLRSDIIWHKPNPMPESVTDRPTSTHEHVFLLSKSKSYYYDSAAIAEPVAQATIERVGQPNWENQAGSDRANGGAKSNGNMKAVVFGGNKGTKAAEGSSGERLYSGNAYVPQTRGSAKGSSFSKGKTAEHQLGRAVEAERDDSSPIRNSRNVWSISTIGYPGAHFATFPPELPRRCILAGCPLGGTVLDPFFGSGTVGFVANTLGRQWLGIELNPDYIFIAHERLYGTLIARTMQCE